MVWEYPNCNLDNVTETSNCDLNVFFFRDFCNIRRITYSYVPIRSNNLNTNYTLSLKKDKSNRHSFYITNEMKTLKYEMGDDIYVNVQYLHITHTYTVSGKQA